MSEDPLYLRLHRQPVLYELVRAISYGGRRPGALKEKCAELSKRYGDHKVTMALHELTMTDEASGLTVLRPQVRKLCTPILGPAPESEEYAERWKDQEPPAEHQPPGPEEQEKPKPRRGRKR